MTFTLTPIKEDGSIGGDVLFATFQGAREHMQEVSDTGDPLAQSHALVLRREIFGQEISIGDLWSWNFKTREFVRIF